MNKNKVAAPALQGQGAANVILFEKQDSKRGNSTAEKVALSDDGFKPLVNFQKRLSKEKGVAKPLEEVVEEIKDGTYSAEIRDLRATTDNNAKSDLKKKLPAFCPAGLRLSYSPMRFARFYGIVVVDVDGIPDGDAEHFRTESKEWEEVVAAFVSPSGNGIKVFWAHDGTESEHSKAWEAATRLMVEAGVPEGSIDPNHEVGRDCFVSWDTEAFFKIPTKRLAVPKQSTPIDTQIPRFIDITDEGGGESTPEEAAFFG